jgi:hypothetical protein
LEEGGDGSPVVDLDAQPPPRGTPTLPVGQREFAAETTLDLPSLTGGAVHLVDVTVTGAKEGNRAEASLASSTRFIELDVFAWSNNTVRVAARNLSGGAVDFGAATLSVAVTKRRISWPRDGGRAAPGTGLGSAPLMRECRLR